MAKDSGSKRTWLSGIPYALGVLALIFLYLLVWAVIKVLLRDWLGWL